MRAGNATARFGTTRTPPLRTFIGIIGPPGSFSVKRSARLVPGQMTLPQMGAAAGKPVPTKASGRDEEKDGHDPAQEGETDEELKAAAGKRVRGMEGQAAPETFPCGPSGAAGSGSSTIQRTDFEHGQTPPTRFSVGMRLLACSGATLPAATSRSVAK